MELSEHQLRSLTNTAPTSLQLLEMNNHLISNEKLDTLKERECIAEYLFVIRCNGIIGVPVTFLDKYCPEQFEIVELGNSRDNFTPNKDYINPIKHTKDGKSVNGGAINCVLAIEQNTMPHNVVYYTSDNSKYLVPPYSRILIRNKGDVVHVNENC